MEVLQEVYFGKESVEPILKQLTVVRDKLAMKPVTPTTNLDPEIIKLNRIVEKIFGFNSFAFYIQPDHLPNAYTWTTAYATLMSIGQMTGNFAANTNKYDDGEANYKLPIFDSKDFKTGSSFWSRGVWGRSGGDYYAWYVYSDRGVNGYDVYFTFGVRPLIYLR